MFTLQPDEGVSVSIGAKIPGTRMRIRPVNMEFRYGTSFLSESPEAYERLILDAMRGDATLFTRNDEIEALWGIVDPILEAWDADTTSEIPTVPGRLGGPEEAEALLDGGRTGGGCERADGPSRPAAAACCERGRLGRAGHDPGRDRGGAARAAAPAPRRQRARSRRRACSTWW